MVVGPAPLWWREFHESMLLEGWEDALPICFLKEIIYFLLLSLPKWNKSTPCESY